MFSTLQLQSRQVASLWHTKQPGAAFGAPTFCTRTVIGPATCLKRSPADTSHRGPDVSAQAVASREENGALSGAERVPTPVVKIDNQSDPFATVVTVQFGDRLGELLDTIAALKNLGLNIRRANIKQGGSNPVNKFYITDSRRSEKITKSARLEEIRLTILNNLLQYHPESASELAFGLQATRPSARDDTRPLGPRARQYVGTKIEVSETDNGNRSMVYVETRDRPGLLVDIVRVLKDISVNVVSAEVDTEGAVASDTFYVTYHGEPLNAPMIQLVTNALHYYLSLAEVEREESY